MLENTGNYDTSVENRPFHALTSARSFKPDLVLLDVDMPGKDGGEIVGEMRKDAFLKGVPVIFLTALVSKHDAGHRQATAHEQFLAKPADLGILVAAIEETLIRTGARKPYHERN